MGSILPNHDAQDQRTDTKEREKKIKKKNQGQTASQHKTNIKITILYDA